MFLLLPVTCSMHVACHSQGSVSPYCDHLVRQGVRSFTNLWFIVLLGSSRTVCVVSTKMNGASKLTINRRVIIIHMGILLFPTEDERLHFFVAIPVSWLSRVSSRVPLQLICSASLAFGAKVGVTTIRSKFIISAVWHEGAQLNVKSRYFCKEGRLGQFMKEKQVQNDHFEICLSFILCRISSIDCFLESGKPVYKKQGQRKPVSCCFRFLEFFSKELHVLPSGPELLFSDVISSMFLRVSI